MGLWIGGDMSFSPSIHNSFLTIERKIEIEKKARELLEKLRNQAGNPTNHRELLTLLSPKMAAALLGYVYNEVEKINCWPPNTKCNHAGEIDPKGTITISLDYPSEVRLFTAAHEIGHAVLHPNEGLHRDIPVKEYGIYKTQRDIKEKEADYFAACLLMPRNLLRTAFQARFLNIPFIFNEHVIFSLGRNDCSSLLTAPESTLEREFILATAKRFNNQNFESLTEHFGGVSKTSMAIRLNELGIVRYP